MTGPLLRPPKLDLSPRESQILALRVAGKSYTEIGGALGISASTVSEHLRKARDKTGFDTVRLMIAHHRRLASRAVA